MIGTVLAGLLALNMQSAEQVEGACKAYQAEHGGDVDCTCFGKLVASDDDLLAELMTLQTPEDLEGASDEMKMTMKACSEKE